MSAVLGKSRDGKSIVVVMLRVCMTFMILGVAYVAAFFYMRIRVHVWFIDPAQSITGYHFGEHTSVEVYNFFLPMIYLTGGLSEEILSAREQEANAELLKSHPVYFWFIDK